MLNIKKYNVGLEGVADGEARKEIELVYHAILEDLSFLENAARSEIQEQWEIKIPKLEDKGIEQRPNICGGTLRVRNVNNGEKYIFCSKTKCSDGSTEVELESTKDQFEQFVKMSTGGMLKTRYYFPIEGTEGSHPEGEFNGALVWEIDRFKKHPDEDFVEWCKIDLELPQGWDKDIPEFPFPTKQMITSQYPNRSEEDEAIVSKLYAEDFCIRH